MAGSKDREGPLLGREPRLVASQIADGAVLNAAAVSDQRVEAVALHETLEIGHPATELALADLHRPPSLRSPQRFCIPHPA